MSNSWHERLEREFKRIQNNVEVPMFYDDFEAWLQTQVEQSTANMYLNWLDKADNYYFDPDWDFWSLLTNAWREADFQKTLKLCKEYEVLIKTDKEFPEEDSPSKKELANWLAAFHKYVAFFEIMCKKAGADKQKHAEMIKASRQTAGNLFLSGAFTQWCLKQSPVKLDEKTVASYIAYIKRVNRELFCKTGHDMLHEYLPVYVRNGNEAKIDEMFGAMDNVLTKRIDNHNETEMKRVAFQNGRSALRKYAEFIKSIINE